MILDRLENAGRYFRLHPGFAAAFGFLRQENLGKLSAGRRDLDGDRLYAVVIRDNGRGREKAVLEAHEKYIDIQFSFAGSDIIGWKTTGECREVAQAFDDESDAALFADEPDAWIATPPGTFAIFFPEDAHAPMAAEGLLEKVVVKVAADWRE